MDNIRFAKPEEIQELEDFLAFNNGEKNRELARKYIQCCFSGDYRKPFFVIAEINGEIIGAAAFSEELFTTELWGISWVSVHESYRNQGIGKKLVQKCLDEIALKAGKKVNIILGTYPDKTRLYDRIGFTKLGQDYRGGWFMTTTTEVEKDSQ